MLLLLLVCGPDNVQGQGVFGARALAMGSVTALPDDNWALFHNPALLPSGPANASFYVMRFAGMEELTDLAAVVSGELAGGTVSAGVHRYGFELFHETRLRSGYRRRTGPLFYGALLSYSHISQGGGYGSAGALAVDLGAGALLGERLLFATRAANINRASYGRSDEILPQELSLGLAWQMSEVAMMVADLVKDVRFPVSFRGGFEIQILSRIHVRTGLTTEPRTWSFGFGYRGLRIEANVAIQRHDVLGMSPGVDIGLLL